MNRMNYFSDPKKPPTVLIPDNKKIRAAKKLLEVTKKGFKEGCWVVYRNKVWKIKTISKVGLLYFQGAHTPVDPRECLLCLYYLLPYKNEEKL